MGVGRYGSESQKYGGQTGKTQKREKGEEDGEEITGQAAG